MELFVKYGGLPFWSRFIDYFYERVTKDSALRLVFAGRNMKCIKEMQLSLLALTLACTHYSDTSIREVHQSLRLTESSYARFMGLYERSLEDLGVEKGDVAFMLEILDSYKFEVIDSD